MEKEIQIERKFDDVADREVIDRTIAALNTNGMDAFYAKDREEAKKKALSLINANGEVMTMTSVTLDELGIAKEINESGKFDSVRKKFEKLAGNKREMKKLGVAPEYTIGSVSALTEDGKLIIASNTGSQLAAEVYGADHVIFVVGANKIVENLDEGMKRVYEYVLPLESERARKAYGVPGSNVSKVLIISREIAPHRVSVVIVDDKLGF